MRVLMLAVAAVALGACTGNQLHRTAATAPTVSYAFDSEKEFREAARRADDYCDENYGRDARLAQPVYGAGEATFVCVDD
jgi:hypothetical protein